MVCASQAAFLARKDAVRPLIAAGYIAIANIILDILLCIVFGWGIHGAAVATALAEVKTTSLSRKPFIL